VTQYILIGSRSDVLWRCYREPGETEQQWQARADAMREAFKYNQRRTNPWDVK
jgi:hypothetical protein